MNLRCALLIFLPVALAACARAQLGSTDAEVQARYGKPTSESEPFSGIKLATYSDHGLTVETSSIGGEVQRVAFRRHGLDKSEVATLLLRNRGETGWDEWQPPGVDPATGGRKIWRSLQPEAMATLEPDTLTLVRAAWNNRSETPVATPAKPAAPEPAKPASPETATQETSQPPEFVPYQRAPRPEELPSPGDSRARVIELLGAPKGILRLGQGESLSYDWGIVELERGKMIRTK